MVKAFSIVVAAFVTSCVSYWDGGPAFKPVTPQDDGAYVVVYRPKKQWGMNQTIYATYKTRDCELVPGAYCVFFFPPGDHELLVGIPFFIESTMTGAVMANQGAINVTTLSWTNVRSTPKTKKLDLKLAAGQVVYVQTEVDTFEEPPTAVIQASADLDDYHLAAGGNARQPVADVPPPPAKTPSGSRAP